MAKKLYAVLTWDSDADAYTPQPGVRMGPYTLFGLRRALRELRRMGYEASRDDPSVLVTEWQPGLRKY